MAETAIFVSDDVYGVIWTIDEGSGTALRGWSIPREAMADSLPRGRSGLAFDGESLYFTTSRARRIWVLEPSTGSVLRQLPKPALEMSALGTGSGTLFVVDSSRRSGVLHAIDPLTGAVLYQSAIPGARLVTGAAPRESLYLAVGDLELREIGLPSRATLRSLSAPEPIHGIAFGGSPPVLFASTGGAAILRADPDSGAIIDVLVCADTVGAELAGATALAAGEIGLAAARPIRAGGAGLADPELEVEETVITAGETVPVRILLTSAVELQGFSLSLLHDPAILSLDEISIQGTRTSAALPDFTTAEVFPNGGTLAVVFDLAPPFQNNVLSPGEDMPIARYLYRCANDDLEGPQVTEVRFADSVFGDPPRDNVLISDGNSIRPRLSSGRITCRPRPVVPGGPEFFCGGPPGPDGLPTDIAGRSGDRVELCFYYAFAEPQGDLIQGVSMALEYDCRLTCLESRFRVPPSSITAQLSADFVDFSCENDPDDGDGCEMVLGILVDSLPPFNQASLPPTDVPLLLACVDLEIGGGVALGECLEVHFHDGLDADGIVPIKNLVSLEGKSVAPRLFSSEVCVTATGPSLYCGSDALDAAGRPEAAVAEPGQEAELCLWYSSPGEDVFALRQAIRFDCRLECLEPTFSIAPEWNGLIRPEWISFRCENNPGDGDGCEMVLEIVPNPPRKILPAANQPARLGCVRLEVAPDAHRGSCLVVEHFDGASGQPGKPVVNEVVLASGSVSPQIFDCRVCVLPAAPPGFFCGGPVLGPDDLPVPFPELKRGERTEVCFWYTSPVDDLSEADEVQGLSMALCHDCNLRCVEGSFRVPPDSITAAVEAEFVEFDCDNDPHDGDGCEMILGLLVDVRPPFDGRTLPPTDTPLKVACVEMEVGPLAKPGFCLDIEFCDGADGTGQVPIKNLVSVESFSFPAETHDCRVCVARLGPKFLCGSGSLGPDQIPTAAMGTAGKRTELCFWYCAPEDGATGHAQLDHLQGLSMALTFDCRLECLEGSFRIPPDSITAALDAEFVEFDCDNDPNDGDGCEMILGILLDVLPPFDGRTLPPTATPLKVACVDLLLPSDASCDDCFPIRFRDGVNGRGAVPVFNLVSAENQSFLAITRDCAACVDRVRDPEFRRGDCNLDGTVDISDPAMAVAFLFADGSWKPFPPCLDACDVNDDGRVDLADAAAVLMYMFRLGRAPPAPGPDTAGPDPTPDKLDCDLPSC